MPYEISSANLIRKIRHLIRTRINSSNPNISFAPEAKDSITKLLLDYQSNMQKVIATFNQSYADFNEQIYAIKVDYSSAIEQNKTQYIDALNRITEHHKKEISAIKAENESFVEARNKDLTILDSENQTLMSSYEQKNNVLQVILKEKKDNLKYLISFPLKNYVDFVSISTDNLESKNEALHAQNSKKLYSFDESNKSLIDHYNNQINDCEQKIKELELELESNTQKIKTIINKQNIRLNDRINAISLQRNKDIAIYKKEYDTQMENIFNDNRNIKDTYATKNRALLQSFANKLSELDANIDKETKSYTLAKAIIMNDFNRQLTQFNSEFKSISNKLDDQIKRLNSDSEHTLQSELKHELNKAKSNFSRQLNELFYATKNKLIEANQESIQALETLKETKFVAEIEKNHDIHSSSLREANDHEIASIKESLINQKYEADTNSSNKSLAILVNDLKTNNEIRLKIHEKDLVTTEYSQKIKIEAIENQKKSFISDRAFATEIEKLVHNKAKFILESEQSLNNILSLLEIEKSKKLKEYNQNTYTNLVEKAEIEYESNRSQAYIERDFYLNINKISADKINNEINNRKEITALGITKSLNAEEHLHSKEKQLFLKKNGQEKFKLYSVRFNEEITMIQQCYKSLNDLLRIFDGFEIDLFEKINSQSSIEKKLDESPTSLHQAILGIGETYSIEVLDEFLTLVNQIIQNRISFETGFKFDSMFAELDDAYSHTQNSFNEEKQALLNKVNEYNEQINNSTVRAFSLDNDASIIKQEILNQSKATNINILNKRLTQINIQINECNRSISQLEKLKHEINNDLKEIPKKIAKEKALYTKSYNKITKEQRLEAKIYYDIINVINSRMNYYKGKYFYLNRLIINSSHQSIQEIKEYFDHYVNERKLLRYNIDSSLTKTKAIFVKRVNLEHQNMLEKYINTYTRNLAIAEKEYNQKENNRIQKYLDIQRTHKLSLNQSNISKQEEIKSHQKKIKNIDLINIRKLNNNEKVKKTNYIDFFNAISGVNANMDYLKKEYLTKINQYNNDYANSFHNLTKKNQNQRIIENLKAKQRKNSYLEEISNKAVSVKYESQMLKNENKNANHLIHLEIKHEHENIIFKEKHINSQIQKCSLQAAKKLYKQNKNKKQELRLLTKKTKSSIKNAIKNAIKNDIASLKSIIKTEQ